MTPSRISLQQRKSMAAFLITVAGLEPFLVACAGSRESRILRADAVGAPNGLRPCRRKGHFFVRSGDRLRPEGWCDVACVMNRFYVTHLSCDVLLS